MESIYHEQFVGVFYIFVLGSCLPQIVPFSTTDFTHFFHLCTTDECSAQGMNCAIKGMLLSCDRVIACFLT